jgi:hypothetical protein
MASGLYISRYKHPPYAINTRYKQPPPAPLHGGDSGKGAQKIRAGVIALPTTTSSTQAAGRHLAVGLCSLNQGHLAIGYWLLAIGYWLLAIGPFL